MMSKIKKAFYAVSSTVMILPAVVSAQYAGPSDPGGVPTAGDADELILEIIQWFLTFLGSLAVLMIVIAGIMYITSSGDEGRVDKAKSILTTAIIGLVIALLGFVIVKTVGSALN